MYTGYTGALLTYPRALPAEEQLRLVAAAQAGDVAARDRLVETSLGLIAHRARKLRSIDRGAAVEDLVQDGVEGLLVAVRRFDLSRGTRFITYAQPWIDNSIRRALWSHREVGLHVANKIGAIVEFWELAESLGPEEAAARVGERHGMRPGAIRAAAEQLARPVHLSADAPAIRDDESSPALIDVLRDAAAVQERRPENPEQIVAAAELRGAFEEMLAGLRLGDRDRAILEGRVLVDPEDELTLQRVADGFGISRERVRQLQVELVARLRAAVRESPRLRDYVGA